MSVTTPAPVQTPVPLDKWGKAFWIDTAERVGVALATAALGVLLAHAGNVKAVTTPAAMWTLLAAPTLAVLVKCLVANLSGVEPTASLVNVTSGPGPLPSKAQIEAAAQVALTAVSGVLDTSPPPGA